MVNRREVHGPIGFALRLIGGASLLRCLLRELRPERDDFSSHPSTIADSEEA
jgi:hypothetical protein